MGCNRLESGGVKAPEGSIPSLSAIFFRARLSN